MDELKNVSKDLFERGYTIFVVTTPEQILWKESFAQEIGLPLHARISELLFEWVTNNASAWNLTPVKALAPCSGITGYAVEIDTVSSLTRALKSVIEQAAVRGDEGMLGKIYRELSEVPRQRTLKSPKSRTSTESTRKARSHSAEAIPTSEQQMKDWFGET